MYISINVYSKLVLCLPAAPNDIFAETSSTTLLQAATKHYMYKLQQVQLQSTCTTCHYNLLHPTTYVNAIYYMLLQNRAAANICYRYY